MTVKNSEGIKRLILCSTAFFNFIGGVYGSDVHIYSPSILFSQDPYMCTSKISCNEEPTGQMDPIPGVKNNMEDISRSQPVYTLILELQKKTKKSDLVEKDFSTFSQNTEHTITFLSMALGRCLEYLSEIDQKEIELLLRNCTSTEASKEEEKNREALKKERGNIKERIYSIANVYKDKLCLNDARLNKEDYVNLSKVFEYQKDYKKRLACLQKAYELANGKEKIKIAFNLASAYIRSGNFSEARKLIPLYTRPIIL